MQLEDARRLHCGGTSLFRTDWTKKYVYGVVASRRLSYYFLLGALFSLVRAPCVGGIYIAIIGIISSQGLASPGLIYLMILYVFSSFRQSFEIALNEHRPEKLYNISIILF
jgi:cytochrome c biogenesis protein CcdA